MTRTFQTHNRRRISMVLWTLVFLFIAAAQLLSRQVSWTVALFLVVACIGCRIAWRRVTIPLYTLTDETLSTPGLLIGDHRVRWQDIKEIRQEEAGMRLIGREWVGTTHINLDHLRSEDRQAFETLVRQYVNSVKTSSRSHPEGA